MVEPVKYRLDLGMAIDESFSVQLPISYDISLMTFIFYLQNKFSSVSSAIGTVIKDNQNNIYPQINPSDLSTYDVSSDYWYWIQQTDSTGFISNIFCGDFEIGEAGHPFEMINVENFSLVIAQIYALRNYFGQSASEEYVTSNPAIDWNNGQTQTLQLVTGNNNLTFANPMSGAKLTIRLKQPLTGYATITLPDNIHWLNNNILVTSNGAGKYDILTLIYYPSDNIYATSYANY